MSVVSRTNDKQCESESDLQKTRSCGTTHLDGRASTGSRLRSPITSVRHLSVVSCDTHPMSGSDPSKIDIRAFVMTRSRVVRRL